MDEILHIVKEIMNKSIDENEELKAIENEITASLLKISIAASAEVYKYNKEHPNEDRDDTLASLLCAVIIARSLSNALETQYNVVNNLLAKYLFGMEEKYG